MAAHSIFLDLFLILISARIVGEIFARFNIPSVMGELFAGVLLGASVFGLVEPNETLMILSEIGIVLLLFQIGLESDFARLVHVGSKSLVIATFGAFFPFFSGFLITQYLFGLNPEAALFVGGTLTATSIGITLRVLQDIHQEHSEIAQIVIGAAVIDDIIGVIVLVFIYDFASSHVFSLDNTIKITTAVMIFLIVAPVAANMLSRLIRHFDSIEHVPGAVVTLIISLVLLLSFLSQQLGAPEILGSFAAGIALSRRFFLPFGLGFLKDPVFLDKVQTTMRPLVHLFTPIFFVMIGLSVDLQHIDFASAAFWEMALILTVVGTLGKYLGAFLIHQRCRMNQSLIGISMIPRGEVGLIFIEIGYLNGFIDSQVHAVLLFVIIVTTIIPPFLLKWLFKYQCSI